MIIKRLFTALVAATLAACAAQPTYTPADAPASTAAPQVKVGDFWEYAVRDGWTGLPRGIYRYEVTRADASGSHVRLTHDGRVLDTLIYAPGWNGRELPLTNTQRFRYEPIYPAYAFPLEPGKRWRTVLKSTDVATGRTYNTHVIAKVAGWERVRVPAGEFDALRIERSVFAGNMEGTRTQEEITEVDWYVPAVRRAVRTSADSLHFDTNGGGDEGGEYPQRIRGDYLIADLVRYSP